MGVGGKFWEMLKPYARSEGFDFLRDKRVAIDLSFWIVQHETALAGHARNPHLRLTFFRTVNLLSKFGAFPVFVVDGTPSPLKARARIARFYRSSGIELSGIPDAEEGVSVERNRVFAKLVRECVELLELFGVPVLRAKGEAEALCAQLDREGHVDACITSDSDAFLFGAKCVIKAFRPNSKEPFECYFMSDIEAGLGLKRKQLVAISLLVGNDHDLNGVQGIGIETALRFVQSFGEDEIINRLYGIGHKGSSMDNLIPSFEGILTNRKCCHCSFCGHPGTKRDHIKISCEFCPESINGGCNKKPDGFKCNCTSCDVGQREIDRKKKECWLSKVRDKIGIEPNFPRDEIIEMYLCDNHGSFTGSDGPDLSWGCPKTELLIDFLAFHQRWQPSYVRQRILPMMSTIFLREMAARPSKSSLYGDFEFDSVNRVKIRYGHKFYVVKWKKVVPTMRNNHDREESDMQRDVIAVDADEPVGVLDELEAPLIQTDDWCQILFTDENLELVRAAFPEEVGRFLREKELKESKRKKSASSKSRPESERFESPTSKSMQLNITEFYRSTKSLTQNENKDDLTDDVDTSQSDGSSKGKRKVSSPNFSKSVRRRLLFN